MENTCKYVCSIGLAKSMDITKYKDKSYQEINLENMFDSCTLYIKIDEFNSLKKLLNNNLIKHRFILVTGDNDHEVVKDIFNNKDEFEIFISNNLIIHWFAQNLNISHKKVSNLPIGLDYHTIYRNINHYWGDNQLPIEQEEMIINIRKDSKHFSERKRKGYVNFEYREFYKYAYDRKEALEQLSKEIIFKESTFVKRVDTWKNQVQYSFVISPFGNGLDCHRTWESLVLGCIPIVKSSGLDSLFKDLPVLIINKWSDITQELLNETINKFSNMEKDFKYEKLLLKYWIDKINSYKNII